MCFVKINLYHPPSDETAGAQEAEIPVCESHHHECGRPIRYLFIAPAQRRSGTIPYWSFPALSVKGLDDRVWVSNAASLLYTLPEKQTTQ